MISTTDVGRSAAGVWLGIDVGGTEVKWVTLGPGGEVRENSSLATPPRGVGDVVEALAGVVGSVADEVRGVGVGVPGHVDRDTGVVRFIPNLPGRWAGFPLADRLADACGLPVHVLNDARAFGLAELRLGAARGLDTVVFVTLGTGVGGALALDGRLLVGPHDQTGEIGHQTYNPSGPECGCGDVGCLEMYASGPALVAAAREQTTAVSGRDGDRTVGSLARLATEGDPVARDVFARAGRALGVVLSSTCALMGARTVVIGGGVAGAFDHFVSYIEDALLGRERMIGVVDVVRATLGTRAGAMGAALWAAEQVGDARR